MAFFFLFFCRMLSCVSFFFIFILVFCVCALKDILRYDRRTLSRPSEVCKKKKLSIKIMRFTACHCCSSLSLVVIRKKVRKKERKKMRIFYCLEFGSFCWSSCSMWAVQEFCLSYDELFWHNLHHKAHRQYFFADIHIFVVLCTLLPLPSNEFVSFRTEFWPLFITFVCTFQVWKESKCSDDTAYMWTAMFCSMRWSDH